MSWQDELKSLDNELSAGRIPAEEYRRRRDELLAAASSNPVSLRRIQRKQPVSIANAFNGESKDPDTPPQRIQQPAAAWRAEAPPQANGPHPGQAAPPVLPKQGAEVFAPGGGPRKARKWPRIVVAVVVLALIAGGVWWFVVSPGSSPQAAAPVTENGQPAEREMLGVESLPTPGDVPLSYSGTLTVDQLQVYQMATPEEAALFADAGTDQVYYRGVTSGNLQYHINAYRTKDTSTSRDLMAKLVERNKRIGMQDVAVSSVPPKVKTQQLFTENTGVYEAVYVSGRAMVRITIAQSVPLADDKLAGAMRRTVDAVTRSVPPS
jgi:hypothetical protein